MRSLRGHGRLRVAALALPVTPVAIATTAPLFVAVALRARALLALLLGRAAALRLSLRLHTGLALRLTRCGSLRLSRLSLRLALMRLPGWALVGAALAVPLRSAASLLEASLRVVAALVVARAVAATASIASIAAMVTTIAAAASITAAASIASITATASIASVAASVTLALALGLGPFDRRSLRCHRRALLRLAE